MKYDNHQKQQMMMKKKEMRKKRSTLSSLSFDDDDDDKFHEDEDENKFKEVNLSGLCLDYFPTSSSTHLNLALISKLDLSNNNLQVSFFLSLSL